MKLKYKLTTETRITISGEKVYRIEAIEDIPKLGIKKGDLGGFISSLTVSGNARVSDNAWVYGDAQVFGNAQVFGDARVSGNARVCGNAQVFGSAWVSGIAQVFGDARVFGSAQVFGNARVFGNAQVFGSAQVYGNARVSIGIVDNISSIIVLVIAMQYNVTIMRKYVQIGCKVFKRREVLKITKNKSLKLGLPAEHYEAYKLMIQGAFKLVKEKA